MIYVYDAPNGQWHGFRGNILEYQSMEYRLVVDWCKENNVIIHFRDEKYIDALKPELPIVYHSVEKAMRKQRRPSTEVRAEQYNKQLHPPYIQVEIALGKHPKYKAIDNYGNRIASGNTLDDLDYSVECFFSLREIYY